MSASPYRLDFDVRDYECDLSGIVNNANYLHYLEHTRHGYLRAQGVDFQDWIRRGIHLVVIRIEVDYLVPLRSGDRFYVTARPRRISRLRFGMDQEVIRLPRSPAEPETLSVKALVVASSMNDAGRPFLPPELETALQRIFV